MINRCQVSVLITVLVACQHPNGVADDQFLISSSFASPLGPEVHVRLHNTAGSRQGFAVVFGATPDNGALCLSGSETRVSRNDQIRGARRQLLSYMGTVESGAWVHEVLALGAYGGTLPCRVVVTGLLGEREFVQTIDVEAPKPDFVGNWDENPDVSVDSKTSWYSYSWMHPLWRRKLIVKTLVTNVGDLPAYLFVMDRDLNCEKSLGARWATYDAYLQGLAFGSIVLNPGEWFVFSNAIDIGSQPTDGATCKGSIVLGTLKRGGEPYELSRVPFDLVDVSSTYSPDAPE